MNEIEKKIEQDYETGARLRERRQDLKVFAAAAMHALVSKYGWGQATEAITSKSVEYARALDKKLQEEQPQ